MTKSDLTILEDLKYAIKDYNSEKKILSYKEIINPEKRLELVYSKDFKNWMLKRFAYTLFKRYFLIIVIASFMIFHHFSNN